MKRILLLLLIPICWSSCKKDAGKTKEILLSEISVDGKVATRLKYSDDNKPVRYESYTNNALTAYFTMSYDANGHLSELGTFSSPGDVPNSRILVECDAQGKITKATHYELQGPAPNTPSSVSTFSYNGQNLLSKLVDKDKNDELISSTNYLYFPDGNIKEIQSFKEASNLLWMWRKVAYSVPNGYSPKGIERLTPILGPEITATYYCDGIQEYTYDQNGVIATHKSTIMSAREFNEDGSLKRQVQTYTSIKPVFPATVVNKSYEYILQ